MKSIFIAVRCQSGTQLDDFEIGESPFVYGESDQRPYGVKSVFPGGPRIDVQQLQVRVVLHFQDM